MAKEVTPEELAEALLCLAKLIVVLDRLGIFGWADDLKWLEDDLLELQQEAR